MISQNKLTQNNPEEEEEKKNLFLLKILSTINRKKTEYLCSLSLFILKEILSVHFFYSILYYLSK